jgi:hypothetical protein
VLLVYRTHHAHRTLLGQVPLGNHPAGLSHITWGLRVNGHRLAPVTIWPSSKRVLPPVC